MNIFKTEPALVIGAATSIIALVTILFGIDDATQKALIAVVGAVVPLIGALVVRSQVTPVSKLNTTDAPASTDGA